MLADRISFDPQALTSLTWTSLPLAPLPFCFDPQALTSLTYYRRDHAG